MHRASSYNMNINRQDVQNSVIRLYFILDALYKPYITYGTGIYQMRCTAYKVAPDDGLI